MTVYFDHYIDGPLAGRRKTLCEWHPVENLLAVAWSGDAATSGVAIFNDEGVESSSQPPPLNEDVITSVVWHPSLKLLVVGTKNGVMYTWREGVSYLTELSDTPHSATVVSHLVWSPSGSVLVSADMGGRVVVWNLARASSNTSNHVISVLFRQRVDDTPVTQLVFRSPPVTSDRRRAAASVSGDQGAMLTSAGARWRPKSCARTATAVCADSSTSVLVATASGVFCHVGETVGCVQLLQADGAIKHVLQHSNMHVPGQRLVQHQVVLVTDTMVMAVFRANSDMILTEVSKVKLSGSSARLHVSWTGRDTLAVCTGEAHVRLWHVPRGDNHVLPLHDVTSSSSLHDYVTAVSYSPYINVLCVASELGRVQFFTIIEPRDENHSLSYTLLYHTTLSSSVTLCRWGTSDHLLCALTTKDVVVMREHRMCTHFNHMVSAVQIAPSQLTVYKHADDSHQLLLNCDLQIRGVHVTDCRVVVWSGRRCVVHEMSADWRHARVTGSFDCDCHTMVAHETCVYALHHNSLLVLSQQGVVKQRVVYDEDVDGHPVCVDVNQHWLVVGCMFASVHVYDLSRRELRQVGQAKRLADELEDVAELMQCRINCSGDLVSCVLAQGNLLPDPKLYIWHVDSGVVRHFDFKLGVDDTCHHQGAPPDSAASNSLPHSMSGDESVMCERFVSVHFWSSDEGSLLVCQTDSLQSVMATAHSSNNTQSRDDKQTADKLVLACLFCSVELGCKLYEVISLSTRQFDCLVGVCVPALFLLRVPDKHTAETQQTDTLSPRTHVRCGAGISLTSRHNDR